MKLLCSVVLALGVCSGLTCGAQTPPLDEFLRDGKLREGLAAYEGAKDNAGRFSLGLLQAVDGLQKFNVEFNHLGLNPEIAGEALPFLRVVTKRDPAAPVETATPEKVARLFGDLRSALLRANKTLAAVDDQPFQVEVDLFAARMDLDGDGKVADDERVLSSINRAFRLVPPGSTGEQAVVRFDTADAAWLQGYTHVASGLLDILTAYDWTPTWNQCAHLVFLKPDPMPAIAEHSVASRPRAFDMIQAADAIAALHETRLDLAHKERLLSARDHFRGMVACSRVCWKRVLAETDNDHEWLPSPTQTGLRGAKITAAEIEGWHKVLDELDAVLTGKKLAPHWRLKDGTGINLDKLAKSPPRLDPVLLIQGSAFLPYVEQGDVSSSDTWESLAQPFGRKFAFFALWSN